MWRNVIILPIVLLASVCAYGQDIDKFDAQKRTLLVPREHYGQASIWSAISYRDVTGSKKSGKPEVTSPQKGDTWRWNHKYFIRWSGFKGSDVNVELYRGSKVMMKIADVSGGAYLGFFPWAVPSSLAEGKKYRIKVTNTSDSSVYDYSDHFTISYSGTTKPNVSSPTSGETWERNKEYAIRWSGFLGHAVKIQLYRGNKLVDTIEKDIWYVESLGRKTWSVPSDLPYATDYRIKVTSNWNKPVYDYSSYFTIGTPLAVTSPTWCDIWQRGSVGNLIQWTSSSGVGSHVNIEMYRGGKLVETIAAGTASDGKYSWNIPSNLTKGEEYRIKVTSTSNSLLYAYSSYFDIKDDCTKKPKVYSPAKGEIWELGKGFSIKWCDLTASEVWYKAAVNIEFYKGNKSVLRWTWPNDGFYYYSSSLSNLLKKPGTNYRIKVSSIEDSSQYAYSEYFTITVTPYFVVTNIPWGTAWKRGTKGNTISWKSKGNAGSKVNIELYRGNTSEKTIAAGTANDGKYQYSVPSGLAEGANFRIKVTSSTDQSVHAYSNYFDINESGTPSPRVYDPDEGSIRRLGDTWNVKWCGFDGAKVIVAEYKGSELLWEDTTPNDGKLWYYPFFRKSGADYRIKITSASDSSQYAYSGYYTVHGTW